MNGSIRSPMTRRHHLRLAYVPSVLVTLTSCLQLEGWTYGTHLPCLLRDHRLGAGTSKGIIGNTVTLCLRMCAHLIARYGRRQIL